MGRSGAGPRRGEFPGGPGIPERLEEDKLPPIHVARAQPRAGEMEDGSVVCRLLAGKTRVAPKCKISIPRMELMGSLVAVRLYQKIKDSLRMDIEGVRFFTDSSAVLGMLNKDSGTFLEFVGTRVSEIRTKSKVDTEWFWIPGELNPADMGTRPTMTPESMGEESTYQKEFPWMYQPVENWPVKKDFTPPPVEEC
jgi:hypothetical protein